MDKVIFFAVLVCMLQLIWEFLFKLKIFISYKIIDFINALIGFNK